MTFSSYYQIFLNYPLCSVLKQILQYCDIRQLGKALSDFFFTSDSTCRQGQYYYTHINDLSESCLQSYCCCCSPHFQNSLSLIQPAACFTCLPVYIYICVCVESRINANRTKYSNEIFFSDYM